MANIDKLSDQQWKLLRTDDVTCYVHGCPTCGKLRACIDFD